MSDPNALLLKAHLKQLKLPTMLAEYDQLAGEAAARDESYHACLLKLTEVEVAARTTNATAARIRAALDRLDRLIVDELGYLSFSRSGAERLFQVFADRYERRSLLITTNLPSGEWGTVFQGERMTAALLDRLTHQCEILELTGESYRFRESMQAKQAKAGRTTKPAKAKK